MPSTPKQKKSQSLPNSPSSNNKTMTQTPSKNNNQVSTLTIENNHHDGSSSSHRNPMNEEDLRQSLTTNPTTTTTSTTGTTLTNSNSTPDTTTTLTNSTPLKCIFSTTHNIDSKFKLLESVDEIIDLKSSQQHDSEYILTLCKRNSGSSDEFYTLTFTPQDLKKDSFSLVKIPNKMKISKSSTIQFQNEYIDINQDHVLHTLKGTSLTISLKKYILKYSSSLDTIEYKYSNSQTLLYLDTSSNTLYSLNYIQNIHSPLVTFKKEFKNISIFEYGHVNNHPSNNDVMNNTLMTHNTEIYYVVSMHDDHSNYYIQIWNSTFNSVMKYSILTQQDSMILSYQHPYLATSQGLFKLFKFTPIPFTKPIQLRNRHLTNQFIEIPKQEHSGFVYSIHDSTQWNQVEQEMIMKKNNLLRLISNQSLCECIKQLPLIEYYHILLEYIYQQLMNNSTSPFFSSGTTTTSASMTTMNNNNNTGTSTSSLLDALFYLLSNSIPIQKSNISIMNSLIQFLLENYTPSHRPCLDLILQLNMLNDEQIISYLNVYGNDKYEYGIQLVLNTQYRNVQVLSMMKHMKVLSFDIIEMILRILSGRECGVLEDHCDSKKYTPSTTSTTTGNTTTTTIEACVVWTQVLIHSHFGDFLRKKECLDLVQEIQSRLNEHVRELKQLSLVKSELGVITSGMTLPKRIILSREENNKTNAIHSSSSHSNGGGGGLSLNGAHWNSNVGDYPRRRVSSSTTTNTTNTSSTTNNTVVVDDYHVSVNVYY
ncbi:hypothetical protein FDP41_010034 [Naegleria fowleri]|uniref:Uncharacterized protein n=1 Tax=Naegleria fowleri TaxID=5763 RepID=A0A6A5BA55_NAEFO|nr:uncharacterized protein FDP41_010034 [Naegleria fowleri]KAF0971811.1 hypothetical protein FDP41_010034 [Naegleria fowleri]CAG4719707.1 unnamed protein product [Naegleria fowleri]